MKKDLSEMLKIVHEDIQKKKNDDLKEFDLTFSQVRALLCVSERSGMITQKEMEDKLFISHSAVHGILKRLEEKGLLAVYPDKTDKRHKIIFITKIGQEKLESLKERKDKTDPTSILTEEEHAAFVFLLEKITNNIICGQEGKPS